MTDHAIPAERHDALLRADAIVRALAACEEPTNGHSTYPTCRLCQNAEWGRSDSSQNELHWAIHDPTCPWVAARARYPETETAS